MNETLKGKITIKLRTLLNREPSESEIINGQTDAALMGQILQDDLTNLEN